MKVSLRVPFAVLAILPFVFAVTLAQSDAPKSGAKASSKTEKARARPPGRVPPYYNQVIDGKQREAIYSIQQQYVPKIIALKAELRELQEKLDAEVEAVLTPEQLAKVKALAEEDKQKQRGTASASASATSTSSTSSDDGDDSDSDASADAKADSNGAKASASSGKAGK